MKSKRDISFLILMIIAVLISACTGAPPATSEVVQATLPEAAEEQPTPATEGRKEVVFWILDSPEIHQVLADRFNESQDQYFVTVRIVEDANLAYKTAVAAGGAEVPDLLITYNETSAEFGPTFVELDKYIADSNLDLNQYAPGMIDLVSLNGKIIGLPTEYAPFFLICNQKAIDETLGEGSTFPRTLEEFGVWLKKMQKTDENGNIIQVGWTPMYPTWYHHIWGRLNGGQYFNPDGTPGITSQEWVEIYSDFQDWFYNDQENVEAMQKFIAGFGDFAEPTDPWYTGQQVCTYQGPWVYTGITQGWFEDQSKLAVAAEDVVAYPFPNRTGELRMFLEMAYMAIPKLSDNIDGAWAFLRFTQLPENIEYRTSAGEIPTFLAKPSQEWLNKVTNPLISQSAELVAQADDIVTYPAFEKWIALRDSMESVMDAAMNGRDVQAALLNVAVSIEK